MVYNVYIYDNHMLVQVNHNISVEELEKLGTTERNIYNNFSEEEPCGFVIYNKDLDKKYYALAV